MIKLLTCVEANSKLTNGKVYEAEATSSDYVRVKCDDGVYRELYMCRFRELVVPDTTPVKKDLKYDHDKPRMALLTGGFPNALEEVGKVLTFGAQKYEAHSWQTVDNGRERYESALMRHLLAPHKGEDTDPESGLLHLTHAAFNALAILEIELRKQKQQ